MFRIFYFPQKDIDDNFKNFFTSFLFDKLSEYGRKKNKIELKHLSEDLKVLNKRYSKKASLDSYFGVLKDSLKITFIKNLVKLILDKEHPYYKIIKSVELGSYKVKKVPVIGIIFQQIPMLYKDCLGYYTKVLNYLENHKELLKKEKSLYNIFKKNRRVVLFQNVIPIR